MHFGWSFRIRYLDDHWKRRSAVNRIEFHVCTIRMPAGTPLDYHKCCSFECKLIDQFYYFFIMQNVNARKFFRVHLGGMCDKRKIMSYSYNLMCAHITCTNSQPLQSYHWLLYKDGVRVLCTRSQSIPFHIIDRTRKKNIFAPDQFSGEWQVAKGASERKRTIDFPTWKTSRRWQRRRNCKKAVTLSITARTNNLSYTVRYRILSLCIRAQPIIKPSVGFYQLLLSRCRPVKNDERRENE